MSVWYTAATNDAHVMEPNVPCYQLQYSRQFIIIELHSTGCFYIIPFRLFFLKIRSLQKYDEYKRARIRALLAVNMIGPLDNEKSLTNRQLQSSTCKLLQSYSWVKYVFKKTVLFSSVLSSKFFFFVKKNPIRDQN